MKRILTSLVTCFLSCFAATLANACGELTACTIIGGDESAGGGEYRYALPEDWDGQTPLKPFVFFHGHNGSGAGIIRNQRLRRALSKAGYLLVAPDGTYFARFNARGWAARKRRENGRNDIAFIEEVLRDLGTHVPVDPARTIVSGFSSGGSMALYFGCYSRNQLRAVISVAGGLRRPLPDEGHCPGGPRNIFHFHGFTDTQVPLEGRAIRSWHQGDVFEGLSVQRATNQCRSNTRKLSTNNGYWCRTWGVDECGSDHTIRFCLHKGGHGLPSGWLSETLSWIDGLSS